MKKTSREKKPYRKDLTGRRRGCIEVISFAERTGWNSRENRWNVKCDCGHLFTMRSGEIMRKAPKLRCKKCHPIGAASPAWRGCGELSKNLFQTYINGAKVRGYSFHLSIEYMWSTYVKQNGICALTGRRLYFNKTFRGQVERTASPDRIDSTKGYVEGNIQWVHRDVNKLKKNMHDIDFIAICCEVADYSRRIA